MGVRSLFAVAVALLFMPVVHAEGDWQATGATTAFTVEDSERFTPVTTGKWKLSGTLEVNFTGRIAPHEGAVLTLFNGVEAIEGKFDAVTLSKPDYLHDIEYTPTSVVLRNLRPNRAPAFPGAEGFGKYTLGGRGGTVHEVTNLNDSGPGSFRAACMAEGPRTVVFRVSGTIPLESSLKIRNSYITIAGQTAPGDGICIKNFQLNFDADHVIIRYLRVRPGDEGCTEQDALGGAGDHIIIDHCSTSWAVDETLSINKGSNLSVQWCMVTESLYDSCHKKGKHGYGGLWGGPGGAYHHNILAHHSSRNPRASGNEESGLLDCRNNVIYNWGFNSAYGGEMWPRNWINNYYKSGPATDSDVRHRIFLQKDPRGRMYADGNYVHKFPKATRDNWKQGIDFAEDGEATEQTLRSNTPYLVALVHTQPAEEAFEITLANAGCSLSRDAVDRRIVDEVRSGKASFGATYEGGGKGIIDSQKDVGGWPVLATLPAPDDTDHDGMPDAWETARNLDPSNPADGALAATPGGYTHLEEYINSLAPPVYGE